jgi:hypothetical protein
MDDPYRGYYGQPLLYAGVNFNALNEDEANGAGTNRMISPNFFETFETLPILIVTGEMLSVFLTECPDYIEPCEQDTIVIPAEGDSVEVKQVA